MARPRLLPDPVGLKFMNLEAPPDWDAEFGFSGPLELEIGSGAGGHALEYCRRHPEVRYLAFEWRKKYARDTQSRGEKMGLKNLRVLEADARAVVPRLFAAGSLAAIHLQFPDPWWKRAHFKRAIILPEFARILLDKLAPGGRFDMRTDVEDRGQAMLSILEEVGFLNPLGRGVFHPYEPEEVPSTRERRYLQSGEPVYRGRLVKPG
ncbi:tRNA (guanine-N7)-methyltransferase [Stigmatella sp. ncwal1]|uniref:tRNA (guanine-N(7)-)-methyltransferase n=1 Tax=Stigmatella ashevillensis TaxID=2995309 RepID=A0ABT5D9R8_9BACT|nr:tRNA (guanine-N7)-methyltransferase [Stigmatella ashevillena]MDC0709794.1 tRNA (guanine-N7)-methyltransferase [Stigmatella ashevillena]